MTTATPEATALQSLLRFWIVALLTTTMKMKMTVTKTW
jgi:hypothetical protein